MANKPEEFPVFTPLDGPMLQNSLKRFSELIQKEFVILIGGQPERFSGIREVTLRNFHSDRTAEGLFSYLSRY
jgi:hypothetical protein